jgi:Rrf2 family iron-sulfur cluster assembly transcriptional regulator
MLFTTKARYAVMAILDIAALDKGKTVSLKEISVRQNITLSYLEQIMNKLSKAGIVSAVKGPGGGYIINSKSITIDKIIDAVGESIKITRCSAISSCMPDNKVLCNAHHLWDGLSMQIRKYFSNISLDDLISGKFKEEIYNNLDKNFKRK